MMRHSRPPKPPGFDSDNRLERARKAVRARVEGGAPLLSKHFPSCWTDFKSVFAEAQHGKCGFCEAKVLVTGFGDVEHYRPKAEVRDLPKDRADLGTHVLHTATPCGRTRGTLVAVVGYWWLAYTWENWLFACTLCNQTYKANFWPVCESPRVAHAEHCEHHETPLLLSPFDGPNPVKALAYSRDGLISERDRSPWGTATIDTCGLDRFELAQERGKIARMVFAYLEALENPEATPTEQRKCEILDQIEKLGRASEPHAGMVRSIVEVFLECDWDDLFSSS